MYRLALKSVVRCINPLQALEAFTMADRQRPAGAEEATPFERAQTFNRRLADKIRDAVAQATAQGSHEVARRLRAIHQEIVEQNRTAFAGRKSSDRRDK